MKQRGYSLAEMMVTLIIMAVIGAFALPAYRSSVVRSQRSVAKTVLAEVQSRQESYLIERKRYAPTLSRLGYPGDTFYIGRDGSARTTSDSATYQVALENAAERTFSVIARPVNGQVADTDCGTLRIKSTGKKEATGKSGLKCWS